jgi:hypothetical protein
VAKIAQRITQANAQCRGVVAVGYVIDTRLGESGHSHVFMRTITQLGRGKIHVRYFSGECRFNTSGCWS